MRHRRVTGSHCIRYSPEGTCRVGGSRHWRGRAGTVSEPVGEDEPPDHGDAEIGKVIEVGVDDVEPPGDRAARSPRWRGCAEVPTVIEPRVIDADFHILSLGTRNGSRSRPALQRGPMPFLNSAQLRPVDFVAPFH